MSQHVEALTAYLEDAVVSLHSRFAYGYGGLTGSQNGPARRTFQARLRLLVEKHYVDALRIRGHNADVWLDYSAEIDADLDTLRPSALVVARQGCEPVEICLGWPARGLKTLRLNPPAVVASRPMTILLGAADAGEALTTALSQMIAAAVVALGANKAMEAA
ncbi:MAG: hypothetical protein ACK4MH_06555 [Brevundimonas sp.]|uniref:hypothetical protein n=1 Tax=Brevundimonas sp. TaxID=1871086 RepID=UPI00391A4870